MSKMQKVWAYLNKPVQEVAADVVNVTKAAALALVVTATGVAATVKTEVAHAQTSPLVTSATEGINAAKADTLSVGAIVIVAIAAIMVVAWIASMLKKH